MTDKELEKVFQQREEKAKDYRKQFLDYLKKEPAIKFPFDIEKALKLLNIEFKSKSGINKISPDYQNLVFHNNSVFFHLEDLAYVIWPNNNPTIVFNENLDSKHKRFFLTHELIHILFPKIINYQTYYSNTYKYYEEEAVINHITQKVLVPPSIFLYLLRKKKFPDIFFLFDVPYKFVINAFFFNLNRLNFSIIYSGYNFDHIENEFLHFPKKLFKSSFANPLVYGDEWQNNIDNLKNNIYTDSTIADINGKAHITIARNESIKKTLNDFQFIDDLKKDFNTARERGNFEYYSRHYSFFSRIGINNIFPKKRAIYFFKNNSFKKKSNYLCVTINFNSYPLILSNNKVKYFIIFLIDDPNETYLAQYNKNNLFFDIFVDSSLYEAYYDENDKSLSPILIKNHWIEELEYIERKYLNEY